MTFATVCTDNYIQYLIKLIRSILRHNKWFDYEIVCFHDQRLSEESKERISKEYENIRFVFVDFSKYESNYKSSIKYFSIEAFGLEGDVIFMDADLLCCGDISPLVNMVQKMDRIGMTKEARRNTEQFNAGLILIPSKFGNQEVYNNLLAFNDREINCQLNDQKLYNHFFNDIEEIDSSYNSMVTEVDDIKGVIFLHYIHKPDHQVGILHLKDWQVNEWNKY